MALEHVEAFDDPSPALEQYVTPNDVASRVLTLADRLGDLDGRVVDLGCGTGVFALGAALAGCDVVGVDLDGDALRTARRNAATLGVEARTDWVRADVRHLPIDVDGATVVMNPPFGAQDRGADRPFLDAALDVGGPVYSIHNEGSHDFVAAHTGAEITHAYAVELTIPHTFSFHSDRRRDVPAEFYRIRP